uniref:Putative secreted protein n=1 Tax=Amblyomma cajennense TaxID=34607 RepID=A0A023FB87_AMBCJ
MYFYYSLFLTTACTMNAFVLHLCRYMHMVQIKQHHTHKKKKCPARTVFVTKVLSQYKRNRQLIFPRTHFCLVQ